jgi:RNA polymerase sigma-70 factor (ECF subfamily)
MVARVTAPVETMDDTLRRAAAGDRGSFAALIKAHEDMVFSIALHYVRDHGRAEDIAQEVFLQLYRKLGEIESASHLTFWLRRVTANRCIDESRRGRSRPVALHDMVDAGEPTSGAPEPDALADRRLRQLLLELPPAQRMALTLRYQEDLDPIEIGRILGMPHNTIKSHLRRGLDALRRWLGEPS